MIGGFRSDLSITRKSDGNFGNVSGVFCFPKSRIKENGGNVHSIIVFVLVFELRVNIAFVN